MNYRQVKAIEQKNKNRIQQLCPNITNDSGIYILTREEAGFKFAYIGQAKSLLTRLASHLTGYQHIDLSLKKHGLHSEKNPTGWKIADFELCDNLDEMEKKYILYYSILGYQLRNKTAGGQNDGKFGIAEIRPAKGYYDGLKQGYENARKDVAKLFDKHLVFASNTPKSNKNQEKAMDKFKIFLGDRRDE